MKTMRLKPAIAVAAFLILPLVGLLAEPRQWTNNEGKTITGELKGVAGENASILVGGRQFDIPLATLSEADQAYIAEWKGAQESAPAAPAEAYDTPTMKALEKSLVKLDGRRISKFELENPEKIEVLAFYSSASWCGPCQAFSPELDRTYKSLKKKYDNFELVLLTADRDKESWEGYIQDHKMSFPSVDFDDDSSRSALRAGKNSNFIPAIHIVSRDGKVLDDASAGAQASLAHLEEILKDMAKAGS